MPAVTTDAERASFLASFDPDLIDWYRPRPAEWRYSRNRKRARRIWITGAAGIKGVTFPARERHELLEFKYFAAFARVRRARGRDRRRRDVRGAIFLSLLVLLLLRSRARRSRRRAVSVRDRLRERARDAIARSVRRDLAAVRGGDGGHRRRRVRRRRARAR